MAKVRPKLGKTRRAAATPEARERRRMEGARLLGKGVSQSEVARRVGVHRQSVSRWAQAIRDEGVWALKAKPAGRRAKLHEKQWRRVEKLLMRTVAGRRRWRLGEVVELIERECGVRYCESGVWRMLKRMGWRRRSRRAEVKPKRKG